MLAHCDPVEMFFDEVINCVEILDGGTDRVKAMPYRWASGEIVARVRVRDKDGAFYFDQRVIRKAVSETQRDYSSRVHGAIEDGYKNILHDRRVAFDRVMSS